MEVFDCVYHGKLNFSDAYNLPVALRKFWITKTTEALKHEHENEAAKLKAQMQASR